MPDQPQQRLNINMPPPDRIAGVHADFVSAWHTPDTFVLDFAAMIHPGRPGQDEDGTPFMQRDAQIVARVKIPPAQVFEIMKALEQQLSSWENETGNRHTPPPVA